MLKFKNTFTKVVLTKDVFKKFHFRTMISGKSPQVARMAYQALNLLTQKNILDNTNKNDQEFLVKETVNFALDNSKGTPQQKEALFSQISSKRFPSNHFYNPYKEITGNVNISWDENTSTDFRTLKELTVLSKFIASGGDNIQEVYCNNDALPLNFPHQLQSNMDFIATIRTNKSEAQKLIEYKQYPFDEKGGQNMFKHSSKGTLGLLSYDENFQNIPIMTEPTSLEKLFERDKLNISQLLKTAENDKLPLDILGKLNYLKTRYKKTNVQNPQEVLEERSFMHRYLWDNIQCHPRYNRSVSFIYTDHPSYPPMSEKELAFVLHFNSLLQDRMYNLDKTQDRKDFLNALIISYKKTVDPDLLSKLHYLNNNGLPFTIKFLDHLFYIWQYNL